MWADVAPSLSKETPYNPPEWTILGKGAGSEVFIVAAQEPSVEYFNFGPEHPLYSDDMTGREKLEIQKKLFDEQDAYPRLTTLFSGHPGAWTQLDVPDRVSTSAPPYPLFTDLVSDDSGFDYIVGTDGQVLRGTSNEEFKDISFVGDRQKNFRQGACLRNEVVLSTETELFRFDGHLANAFYPKS